MPSRIVHRATAANDFSLACWHIDETEEELQAKWAALKTQEQMPLTKVSQRRREWLASRLLMDELFISGINYLTNGKPVLKNGYFSLSHSGNTVGIAASTGEIGLDIQYPTDKLRIIRTKFCSDSERMWLDEQTDMLRALTIVWSTKEAIFKYYGERVAFSDDISIRPFGCNDKHIIADYSGVHGSRTFTLWHQTLDNLEVVVAT